MAVAVSDVSSVSFGTSGGGYRNPVICELDDGYSLVAVRDVGTNQVILRVLDNTTDTLSIGSAVTISGGGTVGQTIELAHLPGSTKAFVGWQTSGTTKGVIVDRSGSSLTVGSTVTLATSANTFDELHFVGLTSSRFAGCPEDGKIHVYDVSGTTITDTANYTLSTISLADLKYLRFIDSQHFIGLEQGGNRKFVVVKIVGSTFTLGTVVTPHAGAFDVHGFVPYSTTLVLVGVSTTTGEFWSLSDVTLTYSSTETDSVASVGLGAFGQRTSNGYLWTGSNQILTDDTYDFVAVGASVYATAARHGSVLHNDDLLNTGTTSTTGVMEVHLWRIVSLGRGWVVGSMSLN